MATDFQGIATQFVTHYYTTFDTDRKSLAGLYRENSMLTFEGAQSLGAASIVEKLTGLPFQKVKHEFGPPDAQPTPNGGIIILVTGQLVVDDESRPLPYSQAFQLCQDANGQWFVFNDVFKLVLG
ncbi:Nuclear transport factor 2 [Staphylotrichum longicolle]|uniref:Nuclear transport factor 2 n=1 Tax=Staphylotrichum longicolle TaxID=669026 RepID=A0AAD4HX42_9PEZI|nr:Nuclear transport factor 2 [Staphylotrichum longicolle]